MDLLLDQKTKDLVLSGGDFSMIDNQLDQLSQRLFVRFKTFQRELFWNTSYGIDYINQVFGIARPKTTVDTLFKNEILSEPMVSQIISYNSVVSNYNYNCTFSVKLKASNIVTTYYILQNENGLDLITESGETLTARIV